MRDPVPSTLFKLSQSKISKYFRCPYDYYLTYIDRDKERRTTYPLLMGTAVHRQVQFMHKKGTAENPLYYKSKESAMNGFNGRWYNLLKEEGDGLEDKNYRSSRVFKERGRVCIHNYWEQMHQLYELGWGEPIAVEKRLEFPIVKYGILLVGEIDQIREVPPERAAVWNWHAVDGNGNLLPGFAPVIQIDLKTGGNSYTPDGFKIKMVGKKWVIDKLARSQYPLHQNLQATIYYYLYEKVFGATPLAFAFDYLRSGRFWITHRTEEDYEDMFEKILHVKDNIEAGSFPKRESEQNCKYCLNFKRCASTKSMKVIVPRQGSNILSDTKIVTPAKKIEEPKQLKLGLKVPRRKR